MGSVRERERSVVMKSVLAGSAVCSLGLVKEEGHWLAVAWLGKAVKFVVGFV